MLELVRRKGIVRGTELDRLGIHRMHLKRLVDRGLLVQRSRGVYEAAEPRMSEHDSIREVVRRYPNRVQSKCTRPRACAAIADSTGRCT
ncbi:MAG: type IV toxin-antitoxin system AbiEi family antitoxin domain-containing protein [Phycisphaeraceae bacterium]